jgi:hypothetical protein
VRLRRSTGKRFLNLVNLLKLAAGFFFAVEAYLFARRLKAGVLPHDLLRYPLLFASFILLGLAKLVQRLASAKTVGFPSRQSLNRSPVSATISTTNERAELYKKFPIYGFAVPVSGPEDLWLSEGLVLGPDKKRPVELKRIQAPSDLKFSTQEEAEQYALERCRAWIDRPENAAGK